MKIDELIQKLESVREEHGNLEVEVQKHGDQPSNAIFFDEVNAMPEVDKVKLRESVYF
jgi:hypothetical protein